MHFYELSLQSATKNHAMVHLLPTYKRQECVDQTGTAHV